MKRRITALALLLCLCLTACGGEEAQQPEEAVRPPQPATLLETASGLSESETLLTVDGRDIPAWKYLYWLAYTCDRLAQRYAEAKLPLDWSAPVSGGTLADYAKDQALADTTLYAVVENWSEAYGAQPAQTAKSANPLPELGLTQAQLEQMEDVGRCYAALWTLCQSGESALSPSQEDLSAFARESQALTLDRILIPAGEDRAAAQEKASQIFAQLNEAGDQAATFQELAAAGGDPAGSRTLLPQDGSLDESLLSAAQDLEENQCSGILESEEGFSILRRLPLDPSPLLEAWFDDSLENASKSAQISVSESYSALDPVSFYDALQQARQRENRRQDGIL